MPNRAQDQVYFYHINLLNFIPSADQIKKIDKNAMINAVVNRQSSTPMFISEFQNITKLDSMVKPFIYQGKISLGQSSLKFSIKFSDLSKNDVYFLKIFVVKDGIQTELTYFKFFVNKYIEAQKVEAKNYFEENYFQKTGARLQAEVFIQKNRAALQILIADTAVQKRKRRSINARKKRQQKIAEQNGANSLTIQKLYKEAKQQKNLRKTMQRNEMAKTVHGLKRRMSKMSNLSIQQSDQSDPQISVTNAKSYQQSQNNNFQGRQKNLITSRKVNDKHNKLDISRISEAVNSENASDLQKTNNLQGFAPQKVLLHRSQYTQKPVNTDKILQNLGLSQPAQDLVSMIQQIQQESSVNTNNKIINQDLNIKGSIPSLSSVSGSFTDDQESRSFIQAIDIDSQESSLAHSSQLSAKSQIEHLVQKKNKFFYTFLLAFALIAIYFLIVPKSSIDYEKNSNKKNKNKR